MSIALDKPLQAILDRLKTWARVNSPWVLHFNSGSCNGCDIEILATLTPRYDLERLGIKLQGSPRHADVLLCTGPVTRQARERLHRIYEQMHEPKFVVAIGSCALSGGAFRGCYNIMGGIDQVIPVDAYIPGCPPRPEAIIDGVVKLLGSLQASAPLNASEASKTLEVSENGRSEKEKTSC
jgi:NADH-quinone oxidoreductase B subunit